MKGKTLREKRREGKELRERREVLGLTQKALAEKLTVSSNTLARWERGEVTIPSFLDLALKTIECEMKKNR